MSQNLDRLPPQTKFIVGNEACERLSYYGVVAILTGYATHLYGGTDEAGRHAKETVHLWKAATYFLPLLGAFIADRYWGRYKTILWISLAYCLGHAVMSANDLLGVTGSIGLDQMKWGLFAGLALLAIGSGGIKPCVSAFVGDQFTGGREKQLPKIYGMFYWSINFGSFFSFTLIPILKQKWGYAVAFLVPGIFMALATIIFWSGRRHYVMVPPTKDLAPVDDATRKMDRATLVRIFVIFAPVIVFWSLFDQQHTTWVQQGMQMREYDLFGFMVTGETMQSINPIFVMSLIPIFTIWLYPMLERMGLRPSPLRRMGTGMVLAAAAFALSAMIQKRIEGGEHLSIWWQAIPYGVMTAGEVLISATGLEFAFSVAPARLKSTIMSLWLLTVFFGNLLAAQVTALNSATNAAGESVRRYSASNEMLMYVGLMLVVAAIFAAIANRFPDTAPTAPQPSPDRDPAPAQ
jgi:proton-dependent oligopeptide transporter, POT family